MTATTTIPDALLARGYRPSAAAHPTFADYWRLIVGDGFAHVAVRFDGSLAVYAVGWSGRPVTRQEFPAGAPADEVMAAVDAAEAELRKAEQAKEPAL